MPRTATRTATPPGRPTVPASRPTLGAIASLLIAASFVGCGPGETPIPQAQKAPVYPVKGKVLLADGKPLTEGTVTAIAVTPPDKPGWTGTGKIESDGSFAMQVPALGDGLPEGEYKIRIESGAQVPVPGPG